MKQSTQGSVLLAGGGTGGHIYPNVAIAEALADVLPELTCRFLLSNREIDQRIADEQKISFDTISARPFSGNPKRWPGFWLAWRQSVAKAKTLLQQHDVRAVVGTGGFVSGPAIAAARKLSIPAALVSLDAVPGRANRWLAKSASQVFTVMPYPAWPDAMTIPMPLRKAAVGPTDPGQARCALGLDPVSHTLLVVGGSSGAKTLNEAVARFIQFREVAVALKSWNIYHVAGPNDCEPLAKAYKSAKLSAQVVPYCSTMGAAWRSATFAISRAGAGSVAEASANCTPTLFLPYPFHKDQHQKLNAQPLVEAGLAQLVIDQIDAERTAHDLAAEALSWLAEPVTALAIRKQYEATQSKESGAATVARWVADHWQSHGAI